MRPHKLSPRTFREIYGKVPRLCVEACVKTQKGLVLTRRAIPPCVGQWHLPGATVQKGEKLADAVRRVVREELGVSARIVKMLGVIEYRFPGYFSHPVSIAFLVRSSRGDFRLDDQADKIGVFKVLPQNTIRAQRDFLAHHLHFKVGGRVS